MSRPIDGDGTLNVSTGRPSREYADACGATATSAAAIITTTAISLPMRRLGCAKSTTARN
jgi:hypothetical protein